MLETDRLTLTEQQRAGLAAELQADRFESKFPGDALAQLRWAIFEEKRRTVRTLISKIIVGKSPDGGRSRTITPILAFDLPLDFPLESPLDFAVLVSGDKSLGFIDTKPNFKFSFTASGIVQRVNTTGSRRPTLAKHPLGLTGAGRFCSGPRFPSHCAVAEKVLDRGSTLKIGKGGCAD